MRQWKFHVHVGEHWVFQVARENAMRLTGVPTVTVEPTTDENQRKTKRNN